MFVQAIENQIFRKAAPQAIRHLNKPDLNIREPIASKVLAQAAREFQVAPPITIHLSDPDLMAGVWHATRETYVVNAKKRAMREAVAAAVSSLNECPYCVTVHKSMFASTGGDARHLDDTSKLGGEVKTAYIWAKNTLSPTAEQIQNPRIAKSDVPQIFGTAIMYHYVNRMVSVFLTESPIALPGMTSAPGKRLAQSFFTFFGRRITKIDPDPGQAVAQIDAELPEEFSWASADPDVAKSLAHFAAAATKAGENAVPEQVRVLVQNHLSKWNGEDPPLSRSWVEDLVAPLREADKHSARLSLITARAAYQVDDNLVNAFRDTTQSDQRLLQTVAWSSFAASRRIASWL